MGSLRDRSKQQRWDADTQNKKREKVLGKKTNGAINNRRKALCDAMGGTWDGTKCR